MVNLKALEAAINKVNNVRHHEFTFEVEGQTITLRILRPEEEALVQMYAQVALEDMNSEGSTQGQYMDLMNRMRQATLGYSIVQLGDMNLRGVEFIDTGEVDAQGQAVSVPKWEAVTGLVTNWGQHMLSEVSKRYGDLVDRAEIHAAKAVKYEEVDFEAEINRVEARLKELREAKAKQDGKAVGGPVPQRIATRPPPQQAQPPQQQQPQQPPPQPPQQQQQPQQQLPPQSPQGRQSAVPQHAPPRERPPEQAPPEQAQAAQEPQYQDERGIMLPDGGDSFFDPSDPGQAMEIEARRQALLHQQHIARQRAQAQEAQMRQEMGIPSAAEQAAQMAEGRREANRPNAVDLSQPSPGRAVNSVRQAANLHNAVADANAGSVRPGRPQRAAPQAQGAGKPAQLHGKPVYKMPAQTLERPARERKHGEPAPGPMQMNPTAGGRNPNFRPKGS